MVLRLEGPDVVTHDWDSRFAVVNGVESIEQGQLVGDHYEFTTSLSLAPEELGKIVRVLAVRPSTGQRLVVTGDLSEEGREIITGEATSGTGSRSSRIQEADPADLLTQVSASGEKRCWFRSRIEEPVNIDVNWVESKVRWRYDTVAGRVYHVSNEVADYWFFPSGWQKDDSYYRAVWYYRDNQSRVVVDADDHFFNNIFCPSIFGGPPTDAYYRNNRIEGRSDGSSSGDATVWLSGGCTAPLRIEHSICWE